MSVIARTSAARTKQSQKKRLLRRTSSARSAFLKFSDEAESSPLGRNDTYCRKCSFFISATDTGVGKTVATFVLATLLQKEGHDVGVMKPIQCGGDDAQFLKRSLKLEDPLKEINPYFAPEPLSPHLAFQRAKIFIFIPQILRSFVHLQNKHDLILVEGAGGLCVPIKNDYLVADLVRDLDLEMIIVSRLGLGTINHTLLTIEQARAKGITVKGIIFCEAKKASRGLPEKTNPQTIERLTGVPILGTIPYLSKLTPEHIVKHCKMDIKKLLSPSTCKPSEQLSKWDKQYVWHPFTQMKDWLKDEPLVIDEGKGNYLIDTEGRRYLDGVSSLWVNVHGHRKTLIDDAVKGQLNKLGHSTFLGLSNTPAIKLAKELVSIAPKGLEKVFYSDNGSTAVEVAIKMAYQYWQNTGKKQKNRVAHLANSYHGDTLGSVSVGGIDLFHQIYKKLIFKAIKIDFPDGYRSTDFEKSVKKMEKLFSKLHKSIAALVVEPIMQGAAGMIVWPDGILKKISKLCKKYDVFLIVDEVATGFGRTGKMFACEHENVSPDFLCLAKGITGGYLPLAATLTTQRVFDGFLFDYKEQKTFFHGHTFTGNPLACAAAFANLEIFRKEKALKRLQPKINYLAQKLKMFYNLASVGDVRQKGLMVGIELVQDRRTKQPFPWEERIGIKVCQKVRERGVILRPLGNVIVLMPPLSITTEELDKLLDVTYWAVESVTNQS